MKIKFINFMLAAALMASASVTFVSCKDTESDDYQEMSYKLADSNSTFGKRYQEVLDSINNLRSSINALRNGTYTKDQVDNLLKTLSDRVDALENQSTSQGSTISGIQNTLTQLANDNSELSQKITDINNELEQLKGNVADQSKIEELTKLYNQLADELKNRATTDQITELTNRIIALEGRGDDDTSWKSQIEDINKKLEDLSNNYSTVSSDVKLVQNRVSALENTLANETWTKDIQDLKTQIANLPKDDISWKEPLDNITKKILPDIEASLKNKIDAADAARNLADSTAAAKETAQKLYDQADRAIKGVQGELAQLREATVAMTSSLVTQVIVQATTSPAVGNLSLPLDIQSNMLVTYYGSNSGEFSFPTAQPGRFYDTDDASALRAGDITASKAQTVADGTLIDKDGQEGNAGTLYVTVNPTNVDASGVKFALENSRGGKSSAIVGKAKASNELLTWGYTRAGGNNLYEVPVTIDKSNINNSDIHANIERTGLRKAVKDVLQDRSETKSNLKTLAKKSAQFIFENMNTSMPRLALATEYAVNINDAKQELKNVSNMNILAAAIRPVGFGALDNVNINNIPGYNRATNALKNFFDNFKLGTFTIGNGNTSHIQPVNVESLGNITITRNGDYIVDTSVKVVLDTTIYDITGSTRINIPIKYQTLVEDPAGSYKTEERETRIDTTVTSTVNPVNLHFEKIIPVKVNINKQIDDLLATVSSDVNSSLTDVKKSVESFNANIKQINDLIDQLNSGINLDARFESQKQNLYNRVTSYLDRINERGTYWFNRAMGAALQPCMLINAKDGVHRLSTVSSVNAGNYNLIPTTYTYELLAPAYKKYVHVYATDGSHDAYDQVIWGDTRDIEVNLKAGKTYRVVYEAVDYTGKVAARTYSFRVK